MLYLAIRLLAPDFYEATVDEAETKFSFFFFHIFIALNTHKNFTNT